MENDVKTISTTNATILFARVLANTDVLTTQTDDEGRKMKVYDVLLARAEKIKESSEMEKKKNGLIEKILTPIAIIVALSLLAGICLTPIGLVLSKFRGVDPDPYFRGAMWAGILAVLMFVAFGVLMYVEASIINKALAACIGDLAPYYPEGSPIIGKEQMKDVKIERLLTAAENAKSAATAVIGQSPVAKEQSTAREVADYAGMSTLKKGDIVEGLVVYESEDLGTYVEVVGKVGLMSATGFSVGMTVKVEVVAINGDTIDLKWVR